MSDAKPLTEAHVRSILTTAVDGIVVIDSQGVVEVFNPAAEKIFGFTAEEVVGNNITMLMPAPYKEQHPQYLHNYLTTGVKKIIGIGREVAGKRKDGSTFPMDLAVSEMHISNERKFTGIVRDITERKRAEARIHSILDTAVDAIIVIESDGTVQHFNAAAERMFGYTAEEVFGRNIKMLMPEPYRSEHDQYLKRYLNTGIKHVIGIGREVRGLRKDGTILTIELGVSEMRIGAERRFTGILRDISDRKRRLALEKEVLVAQSAVQEAKLCSVAKSQFIATLSHELRTPLNGIVGMAGMLLDTPLTIEQQDYMKTLSASADSLLTIINDILDFSKIEAGQVGIQLAPLNLLVAAEDTLELLAAKAVEKRIELALDYPPEAPTTFIGDVGRTRQILTNLVSNAIKFTQTGHVSVKFCIVPVDESQHQITVRVCDTGIGIPEENRASLFQRFYQVDSSAARQHGGTGLGLAISKLLSELMGGELFLESSEVGVGSVFTFTITLKGCQEYSPPKDALTGVRVLVVDDHEQSVQALLSHLNYWKLRPTVVPANDLLQTLDQALTEGDPFRLVLLDGELRDVAVCSLANRVQSSRITGLDTFRVVLLCAHILDAARIRHNFAALMAKPLRWSALYDKLLLLLSPHPKAITTKILTSPSLPKGLLGMHVLLAEDNPVNQKVFAMMLKKFGCHVDIASDGHEANVMYQQQPYDLVLMDCEMPGMDGYKATRLIREYEESSGKKHVPVIALTANVIHGAKQKCLESGMDDYMAKPITQQQIYTCLCKYFVNKEP